MKYIILTIFVILTTGSFGLAYGHVAQVVGDFKLDVGWQNEPPQVGVKNAIEVVVTIATELDKQRFDQIAGRDTGQNTTPTTKGDVSGLAEKLEVDVKLGDKISNIGRGSKTSWRISW
jgi:hypothetical protein